MEADKLPDVGWNKGVRGTKERLEEKGVRKRQQNINAGRE